MTSETPHDRLHSYVVGTLAPEDTEEFRVHLAGCPSCREELAFLEQVRDGVEGHGEAFFDGHPSVDRLVAAVRGEVAEQDARDVLGHLALCATCETEAKWVRGEAPAGVAVPDIMPTGSRPRDPGRWIGWLVAAAASVLLVAFGLRPSETGPGFPRTVFIEPAERAVGRATVVEVQPGATRLSVLIEIDLPASGFPVAVEIVDEASSTIHREEGIERERLSLGAYLGFDCSLRDCPPGRYSVRITSADRAEPVVTQDFEVVRR